MYHVQHRILLPWYTANLLYLIRLRMGTFSLYNTVLNVGIWTICQYLVISKRFPLEVVVIQLMIPFSEVVFSRVTIS